VLGRKFVLEIPAFAKPFPFSTIKNKKATYFFIINSSTMQNNVSVLEKKSENKSKDFRSKLDFVREQVKKEEVKGVLINPNSSVFKFRKGANHSKL
jgi:hypothetical protein